MGHHICWRGPTFSFHHAITRGGSPFCSRLALLLHSSTLNQPLGPRYCGTGVMTLLVSGLNRTTVKTTEQRKEP